MRFFPAVLIAIAVTAPGAFAQNKNKAKEPKPADVVKALQSALAAKDAAAFKAATARAIEMFGRVGEKKSAGMITATAKGLDNKDPVIGMAAAETLAKMPSAASAKALGKLLKVPPKPDGKRVPVHKAAIAAASALARPESLKDLEALLAHKDAEFAVAAAEALGGFRSIDNKKLNPLIGRMIKALAGVEKKIAKLKGKDGAADAERVQSALNASLGKLTGQSLSTSQDWAKWVKESKKKKKEA